MDTNSKRRFMEEHSGILYEMTNITENVKDYRLAEPNDGLTLALFSTGKKLRVIKTLMAALEADKELALRWTLFIRDHKTGYGLGERYLFRLMLNWMAKDASKKYITFKYLKLVVNKFGRWDDIFVLLGTEYEDMMFTLINETLAKDKEAVDNGRYPSKLAKWLPSENSKKRSGRMFAKAFCKYNKMKPKEYRKMLSKLRAKLDLLETRLTKRDFDNIYYTNYPNRALEIFDRKLLKLDPEKYRLFKRNRFLKYHPHAKDPIDLGRYFDRRIKNKFVNEEEVRNKYKNWALPKLVDGVEQSVPNIKIITEKENSYVAKYIKDILYSNNKKNYDPYIRWSIANKDLKNNFPNIRKTENDYYINGFHRNVFKTKGFFDMNSKSFLDTKSLLLDILSEEVYNI